MLRSEKSALRVPSCEILSFSALRFVFGGGAASVPLRLYTSQHSHPELYSSAQYASLPREQFTAQTMSSPSDTIRALLANPQCPCSSRRNLHLPQRRPHSRRRENPPVCRRPTNAGPSAILSTFTTVNDSWSTEAFDVQTIFDDDKENVTVFGTLTYRSRNRKKAAKRPFSIWATVKGGKGRVYAIHGGHTCYYWYF